MRTKADRALLQAVSNDLFKAGEGPAADEQDVGCVDLQELLLRMLASALRRNGGCGPFHQLKQRLLHTFARNVAGDRRVFGLTADLIDFVDIDDPVLGLLDVIVAGLEQLEDDVLDVFAHVACLGQRSRIGHGEGHVEGLGERLG